jgi:uncharacterized protein (DUF433 family)
MNNTINNTIEISEYITANPNVCSGQPVFKGTRVMVYLVLRMLAAGETVEEILVDYPGLTKQHIEAAYWFAASMSERPRVRSLERI